MAGGGTAGAMRAYTVELIPAARKALRHLPPDIQKRIILALALLRDVPRPPNVKKLRGWADRYRIRVGDYRIIYRIKDDALLVLVIRIGHRRDVYDRG